MKKLLDLAHKIWGQYSWLSARVKITFDKPSSSQFNLISSFKKGGKIQIGLNCEDDGLSKANLTLSHSKCQP